MLRILGYGDRRCCKWVVSVILVGVYAMTMLPEAGKYPGIMQVLGC